MKNFIILLLCVLAMVEGVVITNLYYRNRDQQVKIEKLDCEVVQMVERLDDMHEALLAQNDKPTLSQVYKYLVKLKVKEPKVVLKQCILESGWKLNSDVAWQNNNLFGMKLPRMRATTAIGKANGDYAVYPTWKHSVIDYLLWQNTRIYKYKGDYYNFLKKTHYGKNGGYVKKLANVNLSRINL